jgi:hypothetical protein
MKKIQKKQKNQLAFSNLRKRKNGKSPKKRDKYAILKLKGEIKHKVGPYTKTLHPNQAIHRSIA